MSPRRASGAAALLLVLMTPPLLALASGGEPGASLQARIDATPDGGELRLAPGTYQGPVVIRRPIRLVGSGLVGTGLAGGAAVTIDAGGQGSVVQLLTSGAELRGLRLRGSGENHDTLDAGIQVRGDRNIIEDNVLEDVLFGVDLQQSHHNRVLRNRITSKPLELGVRGDGIRLWYSRNNEIAGNIIEDVRDVVVWYSRDNRIVGNRVSGGRYALHFMYSEFNQVEDNRYLHNTVGVFLMYSDGVVLRRNHIAHAQGATGMGVGFKETSEVRLEENRIVDCATGIYLDVSPYQPDTKNHFLGNHIAFNGVGVTFHNDWHSNVFRDNHFEGNFTQVAVRGGGGAARNLWQGNHWDDYEGFDRNRDGRGDTPYELYSYSDRIWQYMPAAAFFRGSPLFEAIDFLDRLAPFSAPTLILQDEAPRFEPGPTGGAGPWPL